MFNILTLIKFLFNFCNNLLIRYPLPNNIGYMWNYGFLSSIALIIQLLTGLFLAMFYTPHVDYAFYSVDHIMHDVMYGWIVRLLHLNSASFFFFFIYIHMFRGLYYKSYHPPRYNTWFTGVTIYLLLMAAAFLGYVLPWGQMSFWAATVITNFFTAVPVIGNDLVVWIWGGFSINNATLNRFFCLHYLLPFVVLVLVLFHILMLHSTGSSTELKVKNCINANIKFYPFFILKDLFTICFFFILLIFILFFYPEMLNHSINYIKSNPLVTPNHIVPEWYFLPFYAILRCISNKEIGILYMLCSILILYVLPKFDLPSNKIHVHNTLYKEDFWIYFCNLVFLGFLGMEPINNVSITFALVSTGIHFIFLLNPYLYTKASLLFLFRTSSQRRRSEQLRLFRTNYFTYHLYPHLNGVVTPLFYFFFFLSELEVPIYFMSIIGVLLFYLLIRLPDIFFFFLYPEKENHTTLDKEIPDIAFTQNLRWNKHCNQNKKGPMYKTTFYYYSWQGHYLSERDHDFHTYVVEVYHVYKTLTRSERRAICREYRKYHNLTDHFRFKRISTTRHFSIDLPKGEIFYMARHMCCFSHTALHWFRIFLFAVTVIDCFIIWLNDN